MEPTVDQIRAARAFLKWSRADLARAVKVSPSTIDRLESGRSSKPVNLLAVRSVFEREGIEFLPGGGVRLQARGCSKA